MFAKQVGVIDKEPNMTNKEKVLYSSKLTGYPEKNDKGYTYKYDTAYLKSEHPMPLSQTV